MSTGNFLKKDKLLLSFAILDILNILIYLYALLNFSLNTICIILAVGVCHLLFALWSIYRSKKAHYVEDYGMVAISQSKYYARSIFIGAGLMILDLLVIIGSSMAIMNQTIGSKYDQGMVEKCRDSINMIIDYDPSAMAQYILNNYSCFFGQGHMFTLVGPYETDFTVSLIQILMQKLLLYPVGYQYAIYGLLVISTLPFIWLLFRMFHTCNMIRKGEEH